MKGCSYNQKHHVKMTPLAERIFLQVVVGKPLKAIFKGAFTLSIGQVFTKTFTSWVLSFCHSFGLTGTDEVSNLYSESQMGLLFNQRKGPSIVLTSNVTLSLIEYVSLPGAEPSFLNVCQNLWTRLR